MRTSDLTRKITEAAIFVAIGVVMLFALRLLELGSSSFFLIATLLAIYTYKNGIEYASIPGISLAAISFVIISPWDVLFYSLPPIISGIVYGYMLKKNINKYLRLTLLVIISLIFDILGTFVTAYIYDINIFTDYLNLVDEISKLFNISESNTLMNTLKCVVIGLIPSTFLLTAILNCFLVILLCEEILARLKLKNREIILFKMNITKVWAILYLIAFVAVLIYSNFVDYSNSLSLVFYSIVLTLFIILAFIMCYQVLLISSIYCNVQNKKWLYFIIAIATLLFFPLAAILGTVFTFKNTYKTLVNNIENYNN